jgi:uncharacterized membrane protein YfhO
MDVVRWVGVGTWVVIVAMALFEIVMIQKEYLWLKVVNVLLYLLGAWLLWSMESLSLGIFVSAVAMLVTSVIIMRQRAIEIVDEKNQEIDALKKKMRHEIEELLEEKKQLIIAVVELMRTSERESDAWKRASVRVSAALAGMEQREDESFTAAVGRTIQEVVTQEM